MMPVSVQHTTGTPNPPTTVEQEFERLAEAWEKAVAHHSSSRIRENHPAYREIIGLGPSVVPILLRDLEVKHRHWFAALQELTGADSIPDSAAGNIPKMVDAW